MITMKNKIISFMLSLVFFSGVLPMVTPSDAFAEEYITLQGGFAAQNTEINAYVVPKEYAGAAIENADLSAISLYQTSSVLDSYGKYNLQIPKEHAGENYVYLTCENESTLQFLEDYKTHGISEINVSDNKITVSGLAESETGYIAIFVLKSGKSYKDLANEDMTAVKSINSVKIEDGGYIAEITDCTIEEGDRLLVSFGNEFVISDINNFSCPIDYYVSTEGNDNNDGSKLAPVSTVAKARELIQHINKNYTRVTVNIAEGEYSETNIAFTQEDSGSDAYPVTYQGTGSNKPTFKNTKEIDIQGFEAISLAEQKLVRDDAKAKVKKIDLSAQGFTESDFTILSLTGHEIYFNGKKQEQAGWPNNGYAIIDEILVPQTDTQNLVFAFYNTELLRWTTAKDPIIEGYMGMEYEKQRVRVGEIDPENYSISYNKNLYGGGKKGYRFRITNLLEELDMPGEYFLDRETLVLYYYPYDTFKAGDKLEVSLKSDAVFSFDNVSNIKLSNIAIAQQNAVGIKADSCTDITIENCYISKLGGKGIVASGTGININKNTLGNIKGIGIDFEKGGDRNLLLENNVTIQNNHMYDIGNIGIYVRRNSVGTQIINNVIHKTMYNPIRIEGNKNYVAYNEIYNSNRETGDSWAIYCGRDLSEYGNEISYNYIHDIYSLYDLNYASNGATTGDDWQSGTTVKNNIIHMGSKNNTVATGTHSRDNTIKYNILVGANAGISLVDRHVWVGSLLERAEVQDAVKSLLDSLDYSTGLNQGYATTEPWLAAYPQISTIYDDLEANDGRFVIKNNEITDNVLVDAPLRYFSTSSSGDHSEMYLKTENNNKIADNHETEDYSIFEDYKNHDFRIKDEVAQNLGLDENIITKSNFDMDEIGIQGEIDTYDKDFLITYPQNNQVLGSGSEMILKWQNTGFADSFTYQIATDSSFQNIVAEDTVYTNYAQINVKRNETYYWRVTANNISKEFGTSVTNSNGTFSFKVSDKPITIENVYISSADNSKIANVYLTNNNENEVNYKILFAGYEDDGRLANISMFDDSIVSGEVNNLHSYDISSIMSKNKSVFIWDKDSRPLSREYSKKTLAEDVADVITLTTLSSGYNELTGVWEEGNTENQKIGTASDKGVSAAMEFSCDSPTYFKVYYKIDTLSDGAENANISVTGGGGNTSDNGTINKTINFKTDSGLVYIGTICAINTNGDGFLKLIVSADTGKISVSEIVLEEVIE